MLNLKQAFAHWHPIEVCGMHRQLLLSLPSPPERPHHQNISKIMRLQAASAHRLAGPRCVSAAAAAASSNAQGLPRSCSKPGAASVAKHSNLSLPLSCAEPAVAGAPTAAHASPLPQRCPSRRRRQHPQPGLHSWQPCPGCGCRRRFLPGLERQCRALMLWPCSGCTCRRHHLPGLECYCRALMLWQCSGCGCRRHCLPGLACHCRALHQWRKGYGFYGISFPRRRRCGTRCAARRRWPSRRRAASAK